MNKVFVVLIVLSIFALLLAINSYIFIRAGGLFSIKKNWIIFFLIGFSAFIFPLASLLVTNFGNIFTKWLYILSASYAGALFFSIFILLIFELINLFFKIDGKIAGIVIIGVVLLISLFSLFNISPKITNIDLNLSNINNELKVVQISDVHLGAIHGYGYMQKVVKKINAQDSDMVLITGDLFDGSGQVPQETVDLLNNIHSPVYFTTGNHEQYYGLEKALSQINKTKVKILRNEKVEFKGMQIIGIDDAGMNRTGIPGLENISINSSQPSILMFHPPQGFDVVSKRGISLQLAGHVHKGQIFPFNLFIHLFYKYTNGLYSQQDTWLYVTSGTGTWGPPMRLFSKSEIVVFNLKKE